LYVLSISTSFYIVKPSVIQPIKPNGTKPTNLMGALKKIWILKVLSIIFIGLTHEYMVTNKYLRKNILTAALILLLNDGIIVRGDTSPISGRVKVTNSSNP
jgi:hypothetical protein